MYGENLFSLMGAYFANIRRMAYCQEHISAQWLCVWNAAVVLGQWYRSAGSFAASWISIWKEEIH